ncbi:MAG: TlpA family protein disulfide reductase [Candidatus Thiodiazotropha sp. (ex Lucina pensylvanica)]|nr:TlpA family protein disulfide reductase [Candidatus Thiodiazotropha sp. (ex Lucina pensylvanica)]
MKSSMLVALYFIFASTASWSAGLGIRSYSEPKFASDFSLPDLTGQIHEGSDYRDRAYIISFWATWCVPCIKELPDLQRAAEILDDENIAILTVNSGESREVIEQFLVQRSVTLPVLLDQDSSMLRQWRVCDPWRQPIKTMIHIVNQTDKLPRAMIWEPIINGDSSEFDSLLYYCLGGKAGAAWYL